MKGLMLYLIMLVGGAAAGAFGVGAYNVVTGAAVVEEAAEGETGETGEEGGGTEETTGDEDPTLGAEGDPDATAEGGAEEPAQGEEDEGSAVQTADGGGAVPGENPAGAVATPVVQVPPPDPDSLARLTENYQRLARIFSAMKPDEAAPVLAQLDDAQLEGILLAMQGRNAAPILAEMDPERAAALSRKVLRGNR